MGKYTRKPMTKEEVAVMEVSGVRTRARALAQKALSALQLRSRCLPKPASAAAAVPDGWAKETTCGESSRQGGAAASRGCSRKKGGANVVKEASLGMPGYCGDDANGVHQMGRKVIERSTSTSSGMTELEVPDIPGLPTPNSARRSIPCIHEVDEFFSEAEQFQQSIFTEKYNYDFINDLPLPGRYEWVRMVQ